MTPATESDDNTGNTAAGQGKLAQVIATRGGLAAPEAPFVIEHREALIYMLCQAAELEHGIMCQYLFAAFSLKQSTTEGLTGQECEAVNRWRKMVLHIAAQEMLHLSLVQNILASIGAAPHMARPNMPMPAAHYPAGVQLELLPFGEEALRHFMFLERPEGMDLADADGIAAVGRAVPNMEKGEIVPRLQDFATVGHLYRSIEAGIAHLTEKYGERWLFVGPPRAQATQHYFRWPELIAVTDAASAQRAVDTILEQGEGPRGDWRNAHFGQFVEVLDEYEQLRAANPEFDPVRPVLAANVRPPERHVTVPLITDPVTSRVTDLFNVGYEILLQIFERFFAHTEETDAQLSTLADATVGLMLRVIKPLGDLITTLPAGPEYPGRTVGPSFELFYETDYLMPHREAAWVLLAERLGEAADFCDTIRAAGGAALDDRLAPIFDALREIQQSLAAHFPSWSAHRPSADMHASLQARVANIARLTTGLSLDEEVAADLLALADAGRRESGIPSELACAAASSITRMRTRLAAAAPAALIEATAAVQQLALACTPPGRQDQLRADWWELQQELAVSIRAATNGPYLATNVPSVRNYLGDRIALPPTVALCRCGASSTKPICDGSHVENGFTEAKDPNRVPDRHDTYVGEQVTVFDNRGICQHSGFCTDRLATVFRAGQDPFVAPSGGRLDEIIRAVRDCPSGALSMALDGTEARELVDWSGRREMDIEVTKDGPYRITGGITLTDADGGDVDRAEGSSREHYALCRCGHSQNKPFCSGMHWYVDFRDPVPAPGQIPTLYEWAGGRPALTRMTRLLYEKLVPADAMLAGVFADMPADLPQREANWLAYVLGAGSNGDAPAVSDAAAMLTTDVQRDRWTLLLGHAANEAGLPTDPAFRAALAAVAEWGSHSDAPTPQWDWGPMGAPTYPVEAPAEPAEQVEVELPGPTEDVEFAKHIKPLFREHDRKSMAFAFDLWARDEVAAHATDILARLQAGTMPCDGTWPDDRIAVFARWTESGMKE